jgi:hypothetical protein
MNLILFIFITAQEKNGRCGGFETATNAIGRQKPKIRP